MRVPLRFFIALPLGLIVGAGFFLALIYHQLGVPTQQAAWCHYLIVKKQALASRLTGPKLLLVSGSSTLFGLSARTIQEETGFPTVNFGLHAGLGTSYILQVAERNARPGDYVLLSLEYEADEVDTISPVVRDDYLLAEDTDSFRHLPLIEKIQMAIRIPYKRLDLTRHPYRPRPTPPDQASPYSLGVETIDDYGDEIYNVHPYDSPSRTSTLGMFCSLKDGYPPGDQPFRTTLAFCRWAKANHVTVLATFPSVLYRPEYDLPAALAAIRRTQDFYASQGIPVLGTAREAMLPADQYYDTIYHLTHAAAIERTRRLVPYLKPWLPTVSSVR